MKTLVIFAAAAAFAASARGEQITAEPDALLDYIEATGSQYINTGVNAETGLKAYVDFAWADFSGNPDWSLLAAATVASKSDNRSRIFLCHMYNGKPFFAYGLKQRKNPAGAVPFVGGQRCEIITDMSSTDSFELIQDGVKTFNDDDREFFATNGNDVNLHLNLFVFATNYGGRADWYGRGKLYEMKIFKKNATTDEFDLLRHYIPCIKDNRAGLYDKVNGTISFSFSKTNFIAGSVTNTVPTPWKALQEQLDEGGTVTLTNDVTATSIDMTLTVTKAVTLDLNGHTIDANGKFRVIEIRSGGHLTLTNGTETAGTITGGIASVGGGVYVDGTFTVSGSPVVYGNTDSEGTASNVYLPSGSSITVDGLSAGASIGVTPENAPTVSSPITFATGAAAGDEARFISDNPALVVDNVNGELRLRPLIPYIDANGTTAYCTNYTVLTGSTSPVTLGSDGETTWYVVNSDVNYKVIALIGNVNLILCDGKTMNADGSSASAITGSETKSLTIYGQTAGTGKLIAMSGGNHGISFGTITINGGTVNAYGSSDFSAIYASSNITINGGTVTATATGTSNSYGIKAGRNITLGWTKADDFIKASSYSGTVTIADGKAFHNGSEVLSSGDVSDKALVNGKTLKPAIPYIAADGNTKYCTDFTVLRTDNPDHLNFWELPGGWYVVEDWNKSEEHNGADFYFKELTVGFQGDAHLILCDGAEMSVSKEGTGGTLVQSSGTLTIYGQSGGTGKLSVTATNDCENALEAKNGLTINGGIISVSSSTTESSYHAIFSFGDVVINGGTVTATVSDQGSAYAIFADNVSILGGNVTANGTVCTMNGNITLSGGTFTANGTINGNATLGWTNASDFIKASSYGGTVTIADGHAFHNGSEVLSSGTVTDKTLVNGKTLIGVDVLEDVATNDVAALATRLGGKQTNIVLNGRTLYKDGKWNTLCLPFNVDLTADGCLLAGATTRTVTAASIEGTTLNLTFGDPVTTLVAGTPYIIKWASGDNIVNPVFTGVTIDATDRSFTSGSGDTQVRFVGTYKSTAFDATDYSILLMGDGNTLYYPTTGAGIGALRAYFKIGDGVALARQLTAFDIDFGETEQTGILSTTNDTNFTNSDYWFTLDGRKLNSMPTEKGIYIVNGKKVVIK